MSGDPRGLLASRLADEFVRRRLPGLQHWPQLTRDDPRFRYPEIVNSADVLLSDASGGGAARTALRMGRTSWSYADLRQRVDGIARALTEAFGLVSGNRVLLRAGNSPMAAAAWLGIVKAGGVAVATMPQLRSRELETIIDKAQISHALCEETLLGELDAARERSASLRHVATFGPVEGGTLAPLMLRHPGPFTAAATSRDDAALIAFTSGTTGPPKGCVAFHGDLLAICDAMPPAVLRPRGDDIFTGTPPLAFTFGLGGLLLFPLRYRAAAAFPEAPGPEALLATIEEQRATVLFTAPTAYRAMLPLVDAFDLGSLRVALASGEHLPPTLWHDWKKATGITLTEVLGSTEMLHAFIGAPADRARPGLAGPVIPGYCARVVDAEFADVADGTTGRLVVRGPTGCRYLDDDRQSAAVQDGWTVTGDLVAREDDGYFRFAGRADDLIVSAGYNISGTEVEDTLLRHPAVRECVVVGRADAQRGMVAAAYVVPAPGAVPGDGLAGELQDFVKTQIAPYKYPRRITFLDSLPRTQTGKLRRRGLDDGS